MLTVLQDRFSNYPGIKQILEKVKADKATRRAQLEEYYDDNKLAAAVGVSTNGSA